MLTRLKRELLDVEPEACLQRNLTDEWLTWLAASADGMLENGNDLEADSSLVGAVIVRILDAKLPERAAMIEVPLEEFHAHVNRYWIELAFEEVHRKTDIKYNQATLETILTDREITTWKEEKDDEEDSSD